MRSTQPRNAGTAISPAFEDRIASDEVTARAAQHRSMPTHPNSGRISRRTSVRRRLLLFLIPSLMLLVVGAAALTYFVALHVATYAYDRSLLDPALDIAANITTDVDGTRLAMQEQAQQALLYDHEDIVVFQVRTPAGDVVVGDRDLARPPPLVAGERAFFDSRLHGEPVRVAVVRSATGMVVQVAETLHKRNRLIWEILAAGVLPTLLIAVATVVLAWTGVARGLSPLSWVRTQLLCRTPEDLQPLDEHSTPVEIAPAVEALNRLFAQLRESNEMQQRFLSNAAHQLRTPLAGLQLHLELLLRRDLPADVHAEIDGLHAATVRASHLANQLLALAKAEARADQANRLAVTDLYAVADDAVHEWVQRAIAAGIDLGFDLAHADIAGNALLLGELLDNLLDNALRYTPAGGTVTVRCGREQGKPYLCVEDNGPGIPESAHGTVFERFSRLAGSPGNGAGLGLSIVKEVVERHRAVLRMETPAGGGTRIVVTFPSVDVDTTVSSNARSTLPEHATLAS
ncbi:MAG TPA: sensor histidine kinase [Casimicrobiaceae bacterium]|nr:sensor histidine kinase [Casimicrobiaceae bacterium]